MDKKFIKLIIVDAILAVAFILFIFFFLSKIITISNTLYIISAFAFITPIIIYKYRENKKLKEIEDVFPVFLRDFVEAMRGGMTLPLAFKSVCNNDYGKLTPHVKKISAQLEWGIPIKVVLFKFSEETGSKLIARIISTVMESHRFGGNLTTTFEALSNTAFEIEKLRSERKLYLHSQMITGYIVFFVFLAVMIGLGRFLVPSLATASKGPGGLGEEIESGLADQYREIFRNLILVQGLFAGLSIGKMSEGAVVAGLKHSLIMMSLGFIIYSIAG